MSITTKLGMFINNITHTILNGAGGVATLENSGDSSIWDTARTFVINIITNSWRIVLTIIMRLLTVVGRFILNIIDFFFIFVAGICNQGQLAILAYLQTEADGVGQDDQRAVGLEEMLFQVGLDAHISVGTQ